MNNLRLREPSWKGRGGRERTNEERLVHYLETFNLLSDRLGQPLAHALTREALAPRPTRAERTAPGRKSRPPPFAARPPRRGRRLKRRRGRRA